MSDLLDKLDPQKKGFKIISLQAENVKRLVAARIDPRGNLVQITGKNAQGKTSVLDSIWWALAGAANVQSAPIRKGQERATIKLDMGAVVVTRTFTRQEGGSPRTTITVESADGARFSSPQCMLDSLLGSLTFDPLAFARMKPEAQFDALKAFVPDVEFDRIDGLHRADFAKRTNVNRRAKELRAQANAIEIPATTPAEKVDEAALMDELAEVGQHNAQIERRKEGRERVAQEIEALRGRAEHDRAEALILRNKAELLEVGAVAHDERRAELEEKIASAEPLPEPKDAAEVRARLDAAKRTNALVDQAARRAKLVADADAAEAESKALTAAMDARDAEKREKIAAAKMPIEGLGFGEGSITFNGEPFDQASDAEQLRVSCAIAMASNSRLKVIRVRDGSLLDEDALALLGRMADENDMQVWIERVDSSGKIGFVIEDGHVRHVGDTPAQAAE